MKQQTMLPASLQIRSSFSKVEGLRRKKSEEGSDQSRRACFERAKSEPVLHSTTLLSINRTSRSNAHAGRINAVSPSDFKAPVCSQSNVSRPTRRGSVEFATSAQSGCLGSFQKTPLTNLAALPRLAGSRCSNSRETVKVALILSEALDGMGLFDEDEDEEHSFASDDPLSLNSSCHSLQRNVSNSAVRQ